MVDFELKGALALVRLDRPETTGMLSRVMLDELREAFVRVAREPHVRACILTDACEGAFGAGTEIADLSTLGEVCEQIERCPVPVIAAVGGPAAGGGCELALACHLLIASTRAQFSLPERKMATGVLMSAEEALRAGLVVRLASPEQLMAEAESLARTIKGLAPLAVRACLLAVTRGTSLPLAEGLALEVELFSKLFSTEDMREGTRAFLEKRAPVFRGK